MKRSVLKRTFKRISILAVLLLLTAASVFTMDFGFLVENEFEAKNDFIFYSPSLTPWLSWQTDNFSVYASGVMFFEYNKYLDNDEGSGWAKPIFRFDLRRTALNLKINEGMSLTAGRIWFEDALGFISSGLYDGARFEMDLPIGTINAGVYYTGLQYKESALILMSGNDYIQYNEPWDEDLSNYFASSRLLAAGRWDLPLFGEANTLSAEFLMQFDLNGEDEYLHSQYIEAKYKFYLPKNLGLIGGAVLETMQDSGGMAAAWGFFAGLGAEMPGSLNDTINTYVKFTSGSTNKDFPAFTPINSVKQGEVFEGSISGLMVISADYGLRLHRTLYTEAFLRYYIRTYDTPMTKDHFFYGGEVWASFAWQPFDDMRLKAGGGAFFPSLGNVYPTDTSPMWKANIIFSMSF